MARRREYEWRNPLPIQNENFPEQEDSFRNYSLYPEEGEIYMEQPKLYPIKVKGPYRSVEHYLDGHFKVFKEDFVNPLRQAIRTYRQIFNANEGSLKINGIEIYPKVKFNSRNKVCFDVEDKINGVNWESTKRFMTGSLLLFTDNDFDESFFLATVVSSDITGLRKKLITVELVDKNTSGILDKCFTMVESESFFTPYFHVLEALQEFNEYNFPFKKYIVDVNVEQQPPGYLSSDFDFFYNIETTSNGEVAQFQFRVLDDSEWPKPTQLGLDISQYSALRSALTNELAIIQGPPGTGKTFIGLKIVEALLMNSQLWNRNKTPILVVCFTNHALDQFLEALLSFTSRLVRIGKTEEGEKLEKFSLREKRKPYAKIKQSSMATDLQVLRSALVVGTTTTLAAKQRRLLTYLAPKIVIVEEAAEVLEAHIIASLTEKCQHLIMIGDHKQLRPNVNEVQSAEKYNLDVSLFERLILNGMPYHMLVSQHRTRPEISQLLVRTIYPNLRNHSSVLGRENIKGMDKNIFFMTHNHIEAQAGGTSKKNDFEARLLLKLANYLLKQGYKPEEITILATYKGQTNYILENSRDLGLPLDIRITTVDNFQGEESKIILLSLVRSNHRNEVGFLKIENRICVALSRARDGFYMVGNMDSLIRGSQRHTKAWTTIRACLMEQKSYGRSLVLRCQVHKDQITHITRPKDFGNVSNGGCRLLCGQILSCGHLCKSKCHGPDPSGHMRCKERCTRICPKGHQCGKKCFESCNLCLCYTQRRPSVHYEPRLYTVNHSRYTPIRQLLKDWLWERCTIL